MLPNAMTAVIVQATLTLATAILDAAALSFLGLGDPDINRAEWGLMLGVDGQRYFEVRPELAYYPAARDHRGRARLHPARRGACARRSTRRTGGDGGADQRPAR